MCLPANSTHISQPLDVAFFAPLKREWRKILEEWQMTNDRTLSKEVFPSLFKKIMSKLEENDCDKNNLISGFEATGIHPLEKNELLKKLPVAETGPDQQSAPEDTCTPSAAVDDSVVELLKKLRHPEKETTTPKEDKSSSWQEYNFK